MRFDGRDGLVAATSLACSTNAFALGDPTVVYAAVAYPVVLGVATLLVLRAGCGARRKVLALASLAAAGCVLWWTWQIPGNSSLLQFWTWASTSAVVLSTAGSVWATRRRAPSSKAKTAVRGHSRQIQFSADCFVPLLPQSSQIRPGLYGFELAYWLAQTLRAAGHSPGYPEPGHRGWSFEITEDGDDGAILRCRNISALDEHARATWEIEVASHSGATHVEETVLAVMSALRKKKLAARVVDTGAVP